MIPINLGLSDFPIPRGVSSDVAGRRFTSFGGGLGLLCTIGGSAGGPMYKNAVGIFLFAYNDIEFACCF